MGMSIKEAIKHGKEQLEIFGGEHKEFIECAIDAMEKYQQIERIIQEYKNGTLVENDGIYGFKKICEVVEDGEID